jgi:hypothetical protein
MKLRTLRLDRIGRLSAPLVAAVLLLGSPSFAPAQSERLPKVGYLGFGASGSANSFPKPDEGAQIFRRQGGHGGIPLCRRTSGGAPAPRPRTRRCESGCHHGCRRRADRGRQERYAHRSDRDGRLRCGHHRLRREPRSSRRQSHGRDLYHLRAHAEAHGGVPRASAVCVPPRGPLQPRERQ